MSEKAQNINIKISDDILKGNYSNMMTVQHTKEEFILDFLNIVPPQGIITSRIITSPGHVKRILEALQDNIVKYEQKFGEIDEAPELTFDNIGFKK